MSGGARRALRRFVDALQRSLFDEAAPVAAPEPATIVTGRSDDAAAPASRRGAAPRAGRQRRNEPVRRSIVLAGEPVAYALQRSARRSIGFIIGAEGLAVRAPLRASEREIEAALRAKARWIVGHLAAQRERHARTAVPVAWVDGMTIDHLGEPLRVVLGAVDITRLVAGAAGGEHVLHVALPPAAVPERIRDAVQSWQQGEALAVFAARVDHFSSVLGVRCTRLSLSSAKTRWGSASCSGAVRLHWRLVQFALPTIDYVVAHELAHLREMNHGPRFWQIVEGAVPDAAGQRRRLREVAQAALQ